MSHLCIVCEAPSKLKCPTCLKQSLPDAFYCSQDCFKANWSTHKTLHAPAPSAPASTGTFNPFPSYFFTGKLRPVYPLSPKRPVPDSIAKPDYANDPQGLPKSELAIRGSTKIKVLEPSAIEKMRTICRLSREVLEEGAKAIRVGVTTDEIDRVVHEACMARNVYPSPLNYYTFPKSCCTSVNEVICHGMHCVK